MLCVVVVEESNENLRGAALGRFRCARQGSVTVVSGAMHVPALCSEHHFDGHARHRILTCLFLGM
jgi:hypothetical protein